MSDKIDRLAELKIDRSDEADDPKRWPWILAGLVLVMAAGAWIGRAIMNAPMQTI